VVTWPMQRPLDIQQKKAQQCHALPHLLTSVCLLQYLVSLLLFMLLGVMGEGAIPGGHRQSAVDGGEDVVGMIIAIAAVVAGGEEGQEVVGQPNDLVKPPQIQAGHSSNCPEGRGGVMNAQVWH
jgi:hypothetical protein